MVESRVIKTYLENVLCPVCCQGDSVFDMWANPNECPGVHMFWKLPASAAAGAGIFFFTLMSVFQIWLLCYVLKDLFVCWLKRLKKEMKLCSQHWFIHVSTVYEIEIWNRMGVEEEGNAKAPGREVGRLLFAALPSPCTYLAAFLREWAGGSFFFFTSLPVALEEEVGCQ